MKISFGVFGVFSTLLILTATGCNSSSNDPTQATDPTIIICPRPPELDETSTEPHPSDENSNANSAKGSSNDSTHDTVNDPTKLDSADAKKIPEIQLVMHGVNPGFDTELGALLKGKIKTVVKTKEDLEPGKRVVFLAFSSSTRVDLTMQIEKEYIDAIKSSGATPVLLWVVNQAQLGFARPYREDEMPIFYLFAKPDFSAVKKANLSDPSIVSENKDEISELVDMIEKEITADASKFDMVPLDSDSP